MASRRDFLRTLGLGSLAAALPACVTRGSPPRPPNIVFILADDLGWRDTSLYGSPFYRTPNIDSLAERGMVFSDAYAASPLCSPTRASIMTGLYPARVGITAPVCHLARVELGKGLLPNAPPPLKWLGADSVTRLDTGYRTLAEAMKDAGYATAHFGKWHLGPEPYDPLAQGFDRDIPHWSGPGPAGSYLAPWRFGPGQTLDTGEPGEHIEDRLTTEAVAFMRENRERPFFLNYWAFSVHAPFHRDRDVKPGKLRAYEDRIDPESPQRNPIMGGMIETLDDNVGRLLQAIDDLGLRENTAIVFFSDNGGIHWLWAEGRPEFGYPDTPITSNAPLRGGKATIYEGGTRVPCVVVWPGVVRPGSRSATPVSSIDWYPTILDMIGSAPAPGQTFDGVSLRPALRGRPLSRDTLFCHFPHGNAPRPGFQPSTSVRRGDWKLIRFYADNDDLSDRFELYNLADDIGESRDLAAAMPRKVQELNREIDAFLERTEAVVPVPNPDYTPDHGNLLGWRVIRNARASVADGALRVETEGRGACLMAAAVPATGSLTVELRMRGNVDGPVRVLWNRAGEGVFPPPRAVAAPFRGDGDWHEVTAEVRVEGPLDALRIDPASAEGTCWIDRIRLRDAGGAVLKEWDF